MDGKGKQKIRYILWAVLAVAAVSAMFFCGIGYGNKIRAKQMEELAVIYPQIKSELQDNFTYYQGQILRLEMIVGTIAIVLILFLTCCFVLLVRREKRLALAEYDREYAIIYEQLLRFQKGDFEIFPELKEINARGNLESVYDKLRELGYYFSDLKITDGGRRKQHKITDYRYFSPVKNAPCFHSHVQ